MLLSWDWGVAEVIVGKAKPLKMIKVEKATCEVDKTIEAAATKVKSNDITRILVAFNAIP